MDLERFRKARNVEYSLLVAIPKDFPIKIDWSMVQSLHKTRISSFSISRIGSLLLRQNLGVDPEADVTPVCFVLFCFFVTSLNLERGDLNMKTKTKKGNSLLPGFKQLAEYYEKQKKNRTKTETKQNQNKTQDKFMSLQKTKTKNSQILPPQSFYMGKSSLF